VTQSYRRQEGCLRLTFEYENGEVAVTDRRYVDMRVPPSEELGARDPATRTGFWLEVHDSQRNVLYRRGMRAPMLRTSGASDPDSESTVRPEAPASGAFSVVVPNLAEGTELVLFASPMGRGRLLESAREFVRVPLRPGLSGRPGRPLPQRPSEE
jgi:hypothetical protein